MTKWSPETANWSPETEADDGARGEGEPGGKGKRREVLEDRKLTLVLVGGSEERGEAGDGRNHLRRPAAGVGDDGPIPSSPCFPGRTARRGGRGKDDGALELLNVARGGRNRRNLPEVRG